MNGPLEWIAAVGTMLAAALVAADWGRKVTGWGFVLFCAVAVTWVASGLTSHAVPIAAMNAVLLLINAWGVWQYLLNPKKRKVIDRVEKVAERIERQVEAEDSA
jgi:nicotinamide riboside transporter PnuC